MKKNLLLSLILAASLAPIHASLMVRELFDGASGYLKDSVGDNASSVGFLSGSVWQVNIPEATYSPYKYNVINSGDLNSGVPNQLPAQMGSAGYLQYNIQGSGNANLYNYNNWATRALASGAGVNLAADGTYYLSFVVVRRNNCQLGFGLSAGAGTNSPFLAVGLTSNKPYPYTVNIGNRLGLVIGDGLAGSGSPAQYGPYTATVYATNAPSTPTGFTDGVAYLVVAKITASASGNDTLKAALFAPSRSGFTSVPYDDSSIAWDVTYSFNSSINCTHLLAYLYGGTSDLPLDAFRLGTTLQDVVNFAPSIATQPTMSPTNYLYTGMTVALTNLVVSGAPTLSYQWYRNGAVISGATTNTYTRGNLSPADSGDYYVVINSSYGSANSATNTLTVVAAPPTLIQDIAPVSRYPHGYVTLTPVIGGSAPIYYQWKKGAANITDATNLTLTLSNIQLSDQASYSLWVTNATGWTNTSAAALTVLTPAAGSFEEIVVTNRAIAYWRFNELSGSVAYDYMGGNNANHTAVGIATGTGLESPTYPGLESGNPAGSYDGASSISATMVSLMNNRTQYTIMGWFKPAVMPQLGTGDSRVALFGQNGPAELGFRSNALGLSAPGAGFAAFNPNGVVLAGNWYLMTAVADGAKMSVYLNGNLIAELSQTMTNYGSSSDFFNIGAAVLDSTGNYFNGLIDEVSVFDRALAAGNVGAFYQRASGVAPPVVAPLISTQPQGAQRYAGRSAHLTVTADGTLPLSYQWYKNGALLSDSGNVAGSLTASLTITNLGAANAGNYEVVVYNGAGSVTSAPPAVIGVISTTPGGYDSLVVGLKPYAYWRLNEPFASTTAYDFWGGYDGVYGSDSSAGEAGPQAPGFYGFESTNTALGLPGSALNAWVTNAPLNLNTNTVTISAWVYPSRGQIGYTSLFYCRGGGTVSGLFCNTTWNELAFAWNGFYDWHSGLILPTNEWSFVALTITPTNGTLYLGTGSTLKSAVQTLPNAVQTFSSPAWIGSDPQDSVNRMFVGVIDEVVVFNRTLEPSQIQQLFENGAGLVRLQVQQSGNDVILSWSHGLLQFTQDLTPSPAWTDLPTATSPYTNSVSGPLKKFFRVKVQ